RAEEMGCYSRQGGYPMLRRSVSTALGVALFAMATTALAQHEAHGGGLNTQGMQGIQGNLALNVTEIVTGLAAALMALQAALAYREGRLARGMLLAAVGMVVMAVGHVILVLRRIINVDVLGFLGASGSFVAFS